jgi:hypothetical protein
LNETPPVIGVSNVVAFGIEEMEFWREIVAFAHQSVPNQPLVGYERGLSLDCAVQANFEPIGPLRVWWRPG